jgi:hypothetical protein
MLYSEKPDIHRAWPRCRHEGKAEALYEAADTFFRLRRAQSLNYVARAIRAHQPSSPSTKTDEWQYPESIAGAIRGRRSDQRSTAYRSHISRDNYWVVWGLYDAWPYVRVSVKVTDAFGRCQL